MSKSIAMQPMNQPKPPMPSAERGAATEEQIRLRAYQLYEERGCEPGREVEDWMKAESELLAPAGVHRAA